MHTGHQQAEPNYGMGQKTFKVYFFGVIMSAVLTLIPFAAVMYHYYSKGLTLAILLICALVQFLVQVICFLRLNIQSDEGKTNVLLFIFAIVVLIAIIGGSVWIMYHLNYNMMH
jgi:cytochrome o ubiquinol oxidase subunit IV